MPEREDDHEALAAGLAIDMGRRIKLRRIQLGLSQSDLARKIGPVAFQQVQKYENGTDRVSASRLYLIAEAYRSPKQSIEPATAAVSMPAAHLASASGFSTGSTTPIEVSNASAT